MGSIAKPRPDLGFQKRVETVANLVANDYRTMEVDDGVQTSRLKREHPCEEEQDERVVKLRGASVGEIDKEQRNILAVDTPGHGNPRVEEACHQANSSSVAAALHAALTEDLALARSAASQPQKRRQKLENFAAQNRGWTTIRIFCSSTFRDMLGERHVLQTAILPALQVWGRERFIDFSVVDLVWGVVEGARPQETIEICLNAIDECAASSGSPFFLFLGGERYGWVPKPEDVGEQLSAKYKWVPGASVTTMELLHGALRRHNPNAVFCLRDKAYASQKCAADFIDSSKSCAVLRDLIAANMPHGSIIKYNPSIASSQSDRKIGPSGGLDWSDFIEHVTAAVRTRVECQYPLIPSLLPGLPAMRQEHARVADTLADSTVHRAGIMAELHTAVDSAGPGRRLIVLGGESGTGKSSCMAQLAVEVGIRAQGKFLVIQHFVGLAERSNDIFTLARRITGEIMRARDEEVNESRLGDDMTEACAFARETLSVEPASMALTCVLIIDAINQLEGDPVNALDWLPSAQDCANLPAGIVIIVSCTPGELLTQLTNRAGRECITLGALTVADSRAITERLLKRNTKRFSSSQMDAFLNNVGASNPLWLSIAMSRLTKHAQFETLSILIDNLPPTLDGLVAMQLAVAEDKAGKSLVASLLMTAAMTRQGLLESEALKILPAIACAMTQIHILVEDEVFALLERKKFIHTAGPGEQLLELSSFDWIQLRSLLDAFLRHGPTGILAPSHAIVHAAILERYGGGELGLPTQLVCRGVAAYFETEDPTINQNRRSIELPWARLKLRDGPGLARALCNVSVFRQKWYLQGEAMRWEMFRYWRKAGKLIAETTNSLPVDIPPASDRNVDVEDDQEAKDDQSSNIIVEHLVRFGCAMSADIGKSVKATFHAIELERAVVDLLRMMRCEHKALELLQNVQTQLQAALTLDSDSGNSMREYTWALEGAMAWTYRSIGCCQHANGLYKDAISTVEQAIVATGKVPCLVEHPTLAASHLELARYLNSEKQLDRQLVELRKAQALFSKIGERAAAQDAQLGSDTNSSNHIATIKDLFDPCKMSQKEALACAVGHDTSYNFVSAQTNQAEIEKELGNFFFDKYEETKDYQELDWATTHYTRALALCRRVYGEGHPKTARALWGLGIVQKERGELELSVKTHVDVLKVFSRVYGAQHQDTADMHYNIGCIYNDVASAAENRAEHARVTGVPSAVASAGAEAAQAGTLAESHLRSSLAVYIKVLGPRHRDVGFTLNDVGLVCVRNGKLHEAKKLLEEAVDIRRESIGAQHADTLQSQAALDQVMMKMESMAGIVLQAP